MHRGQASITSIEATVGVMLLLTLTFTFALGVPGEQTPQAQTQLDAYADDAVTILSNEQPRHGDQTRLAEVTESAERFDREATALRERVEEILPPNVLWELETAYGAVGHDRPDGVRTGTATTATTNGDVRLTVWYP